MYLYIAILSIVLIVSTITIQRYNTVRYNSKKEYCESVDALSVNVDKYIEDMNQIIQSLNMDNINVENVVNDMKNIQSKSPEVNNLRQKYIEDSENADTVSIVSLIFIVLLLLKYAYDVYKKD